MSSPPVTRRSLLRSAAIIGTGAAAAGTGVFSGTAHAAAGPAPTIPAIQQWTAAGDPYTFSASARIVVDPAYSGQLGGDAFTFREDLLAMAAVNLPIVHDSAASLRSGDIFLTLGSADAGIGDEGYIMTIGQVLRIQARTATGLFYGTRTFLQLLRTSSTIAGGTIRDWPRYPERGLLIANERKWFSQHWWREQIRELSYIKMNMLWYYVGYQTISLSEMKAVADFALRYHITVVPQFNMPGHLEFELEGHPELHLPGRPNSLDLSRQAGYDYAHNKLATLMPEFPATPAWHLGADEYLIGSDYANFPQLEQYAKAHYGPAAKGIDTFYGFVNICNDQVRAAGKTMRIWNDGLHAGPVVEVDRNIIVEHWIGYGRSAGDLLSDGYQLQNSNIDFVYYDLGGRQPDAAKIYEQFRVGRFHGTSVSDDHPSLRGAKMHVWTLPDRESEQQINNTLFAPMRSLAQITWGSPKPATTYAGFAPIISTLGRAPGNKIWLTNQTGLSGRSFPIIDGTEQHVFANAGAAGGVLHWWWSDRSNRVASDHWRGGPIKGKPTGYPHGHEQLVFARGNDDALRHWSWYPGILYDLPQVDTWDAGPGTVTSDPTGFAYFQQQHVFYRSASGTLTHRWFDRNNGRVYADDWGGDLAGNPASYVHGNEQHVLARGADGSLRHWWWYPDIAGNLPGRDNWGAGPGTVHSDPAGFAYADQEHVFYRNADGTLAHRWYDHSSGGVGHQNWGGQFVGNPVAYVHYDEQHVFARGTDGTLRHWWWYPGIPNDRPGYDTWDAGRAPSPTTPPATPSPTRNTSSSVPPTAPSTTVSTTTRPHESSTTPGAGRSLNTSPAKEAVPRQRHRPRGVTQTSGRGQAGRPGKVAWMRVLAVTRL